MKFIQFLLNLFRPQEQRVDGPAALEQPTAAVPEESSAAVPEERKPRVEIATGRAFRDLPLHPEVLRGIEATGFERCTEVQDKALPITLDGQGIAAQAQTGSGKTAVFLISIFEKALRARDRGESFGKALILAPTRELALQIYRDAEALGRDCGLRYAVILGGVAYEQQIEALKADADVVIATPGRLIDLMKQQLFDPRQVTILVVDEADRMLDMGFIRDLRYIFRRLRHYDQRQSLLFSATLSARVLELTYEYMNISEEISVNRKDLLVETVEQCVHHVGANEKLRLLLGLLHRESWERVLIFTNTKAEAMRVAQVLAGNDYSSNAITGDLPQKQRISTLSRFMSGQVPILVATDVASRGLHVDDVSHVINYDVPQDREEYVHRIGRTARAGKTGKAITLATERDVHNLAPIEELLGLKIPVVWPEEDWFMTDRSRGGRQGTERPGVPQRRRRPPTGGRTAEAAAGPKAAEAKSARAKPRAEGRGRRPSRRRGRGAGPRQAESGS